MDKPQRIEMYKAYLIEEGYKPEVDADGDLFFKREGRRFLLLAETKDDEYFQIIFPNFWKIETEPERQKVLAACALACASTKVAKVYPIKNNVWAAYETLLPKPEDFKSIFPRALSILDAGIRTFLDSMKPPQAAQSETADATKQPAA